MEEATLTKVKAMCIRLADYHWSPLHPSTYVIPAPGGETRGVGLIAHNNYAAFNLAWGLCYGKWQTQEDQLNLVGNFTRFQRHTHHLVNDVPIQDWACLLKPKAFSMLLIQHKGLPIEVHNLLKSAAIGATHNEL